MLVSSPFVLCVSVFYLPASSHFSFSRFSYLPSCVFLKHTNKHTHTKMNHLESPQLAGRARSSLVRSWSAIFNDPVYVRWATRKIGHPRRLSLLGSWLCCCTSPLALKRSLSSSMPADKEDGGGVSLLKSLYHLTALLLWLLIAGYLLTEATPTLAVYCPDGGDDWLLLLVLHIIGSYAFLRLYLLDSVLFLPVFAVPLLALLWSFDRRLTRVITLDLTGEQLEHYSVFKHRMVAMGTCKLALTLTSALLHVSFGLLLFILLLRGVSWLLAFRKQVAGRRSIDTGRLLSVLWRKNAAENVEISF